jgi:hypothetical protein
MTSIAAVLELLLSRHHADVSQCCCLCSASSEVSESQTHASLANHSCVASQCGQWVCPKNTGLERKAAASTCVPVEIARPVFEQRIIRVPIYGLLPSYGYGGRTAHVRRKDKSPMAIHGFSCGAVIAASRWPNVWTKPLPNCGKPPNLIQIRHDMSMSMRSLSTRRVAGMTPSTR